MARIIIVHGVGHQFAGEQMLRQSWIPALQSGLQLANSWVDEYDVAAVFYGHLFRPSGTMAGDSLPPYSAADLDPAIYQELLLQYWDAAAEAEPTTIMPRDSKTKGAIWNQTQRALNHLCQSKFFSGLLERALIADFKQANLYLTSADIRKKTQERLAAKITADTRVIVAHSLGTVLAYESLCANPTWPVTTFVSLGSPLGIRNFFFDRLTPPPNAELTGQWPAGLKRWTNIADQSDIVALQKQLVPRFGNRVRDILVCNGAHAHDATIYLTAKETGEAIAAGLQD